MVQAIFLVLLAAAGHAQGLGKWKLNIEKSSFQPGPGPASETYIYEAAPGGQISTRVRIGRDGRQLTDRIVEIFDGKWYPLAGHRHADEICTREISDHVVVSTFKRKGEVVLACTRVVSPDGKVTTMTLDGMGVEGKIHNVRVLERQ
jgi:hypothetical protein